MATIFVVLSAPSAFAKGTDDDAARCAASYESAQVLRRGEHLEAARAQLLVCEGTCPSSLAKDCSEWRRGVDALIPTVLPIARDAGNHALSGVRITVDGSLPPRDDGAIAVEPGTHVFKFEKDGFVSLEARAEVHAGDRNHPLDVVLVAETTVVATPLRPVPTKPATASYVSGGFGIAALATAGVLAIAGDIDRSNLRSSCAPTCDSAQVNTVSTLWWTAGGLAAAGVVAIGVGIVLWPRSPQNSATSPTMSIGPRSLTLAWRLP
ncbi:MAG: hypothetical protein ABI183_00420 [Polyangiaceae bacterium]